ncbi:MAG TPA: glycosyltransferase family 39 protein [Nitrospira sp.]|nr:glycosyltransferase family 39 protein [Nitrospira sp.]
MEESTPLSRHLVNLAALAVLAGILFFVGLGSMGLTDRDEGRNAEAGREMLETGDWVSPTFNYEPRYAKPVLVYWLMAVSYSLFGVNEFAARLPSAFFGLLLILMQYAGLSRLLGPTVGLLGSLMLLLNIEIIGLSRIALTDSVLIFFTTLSLWAFWLGFSRSAKGWMWLFYVGMALATLAKGPVGFLVPLVTVLLYLAITSGWRPFWNHGRPVAGTAVFVLLALPWYAVMWSIHGQEYVAIAQSNTVGRFLSPMEGHSFTVLFYLPVLLFGFFPWSGWLPFAWYQAYRSWREARETLGVKRDASGELSPASHITHDASQSDARLEWFAAVWVLGTFIFFTLSSTRLPHYIGPLFPGAAILTACYWHRGLTEPATKGVRASIHTTMALGYVLAVGFAALPSVYPSIAEKLVKEFPLALDFNLGSGPYVASTLLLIGMALLGYFGLSDSRRAAAFWVAGATLAFLVLTVVQLVVPGVNKYFISPPQVLAYAAGVNLQPGDRLLVYGSTRPSTVFYARRKATFVPAGEEGSIVQALAQSGRTMVILPQSFRSKLPPEADKLVPILKQHGYLLLADQPMVAIPEGATRPRTLPAH